MEDNWNELFDSIKEEDILRNLPEDLPEMEDELAAKRIENRVMQEIKINIGIQKKQSRKKLLTAAVCFLTVIGLLGYKPIQAAFQRLFHDLPGVGGYINDEDVKVYEIKIDDPVQEKNGIRVELKDFYCEGNIMYGTFEFTGEGLPSVNDEEDREEWQKMRDDLEERFKMTCYYGEKSRILYAPRTGTLIEDGQLIRYTRKCEEMLPLQAGYFTYQIEINGFDRKFNLEIVEPKTAETPEELGYSQTLNDTTITARAAVTDEGIELEYYIIPSAEVEMAIENQYRYFTANVPYQFDFEDRIYAETAAGERLEYEKYRTLTNGFKFLYEGSEEDFPLTFHRPTLTGTNDENYTLTLALPKDGETFTENLPKVEFQYGTVEILSVKRINGEYDNRDAINPQLLPATIVDIVYRITPKEGLRQMYSVDMEIEEEWGETYGGEGMDAGDDYYMDGGRYYLTDLKKEELKVKFHMPSFWIMGDYDIVIEKPMAK